MIWGAERQAIDAKVEAERKDLVSLQQELRSVRAQAEEAAAVLAGLRSEDAHADPRDLLAVVDAMISSATTRLDAATDAVLEEVGALLAAALQTAQAVVAEVGVDASRIESIRPRPITVPPKRRRPRSASELWSSVERGKETDAGVGDLVLDTDTHRPDVSGWDATEVNEWFWRDVRSDHPVRDRLFKLGQREQ